MTCLFSLLGILTDFPRSPFSRSGTGIEVKRNVDRLLGVKAKNRGQSYVHISLTIASRGVIALLIGILIKSERPILSRQFPFRLIIRPLITPPQITASVTVERTHADASYVKYNIEHRAGGEKSQSKPLSPSFSPLSLFSSWCHCILWLIGT